MIIPVKKYLFFGTKEDLDEFFQRAQNQGYIEFIAPSGKRAVETPIEIQTLLSALRILRKLPSKKPYTGGGPSAFAIETAQRILSLKGEIDKLSEEVRILEAEISRVGPFGDFSMDDIDYIEREGKRKIQFFCMKTAKSHKTNFTDEVIYIDTVYDLDYFITINKESRSYPEMIEMRVDKSATQLQTHLSFVKESLHLLEAELKGLAGHKEFLQHVLLELLNDHQLVAAKKEVQFPLGASLFSVEAWIPQNKVVSVFAMVDGMKIDAEEIAVDEGEKVPTYMENEKERKIGEDLVKIYDIPAPTDKDPSGWVFWAFALFFAFVVSDAGYGFLFLALALFLKYKFPQAKGASKRFFKLALALSVSCIIWGVAISSFFGLDFSPESKISKYSALGYLAKKKAEYHIVEKDDVYNYWVKKIPTLSETKNADEFLMKATKEENGRVGYIAYDEFKDNILLELSLLLGVIHVSLSLLRNLKRHLAGIGWLAFLVGGYLYFPSILHCTSLLNFLEVIDKPLATKVGLQLIYGGIGVAVLLAFIQKRFKGFSEIAAVVQIFADVLSYLRLYALALAGAMLASTFNDLGRAVGLVAGGVVILFGHLVNIQLGTMAGVIHGLRLNFIEWYHYSFEGGGKLFRPLKKLK
jgi:V/A-type H+-transporting ATPase subunit I